MAGEQSTRSEGPIRRPADLVFGILLLALAGGGFYGSSNLPFGSAVRMGPGFFPTILSTSLALLALILLAGAFVGPRGTRLEAWHWLNLGLILGAFAVFALTLERLGLLVAVGLLVVIASLAAPDRRWWEVLAFAGASAAGAALLFKTLLGIPLEIWPPLWS